MQRSTRGASSTNEPSTPVKTCADERSCCVIKKSQSFLSDSQTNKHLNGTPICCKAQCSVPSPVQTLPTVTIDSHCRGAHWPGASKQSPKTAVESECLEVGPLRLRFALLRLAATLLFNFDLALGRLFRGPVASSRWLGFFFFCEGRPVGVFFTLVGTVALGGFGWPAAGFLFNFTLTLLVFLFIFELTLLVFLFESGSSSNWLFGGPASFLARGFLPMKVVTLIDEVLAGSRVRIVTFEEERSQLKSID